MKLIVGLGNPGQEYENTRHNCGFMAVLHLREKNNFPAFKFNKKFNAMVSKGKIGKEEIVLALPQTFMNESGRAVRAIVSYYKIKPENILAIYDDLDLPLRKIRLRPRGSAGGHKGVQSIIDNLGTGDFARLRIGINPSIAQRPMPSPRKIPAKKFVLRKFSSKEKKVLDETIEKAAAAIKFFLRKGIDQAMADYN